MFPLHLFLILKIVPIIGRHYQEWVLVNPQHFRLFLFIMYRKVIPSLGLFLLLSCGRTDNAYIVNNTQDTLTIALKLNYPTNQNRPDNYFREEIIHKVKSPVKDWKLAGDCVVDFDSINNCAKLVLLPNDKLKLGTIRSGLTRDNFETWEFTEMAVHGRNVEISAKNKGLLNFVKKDKSWFSQDSHYLLLGRE